MQKTNRLLYSVVGLFFVLHCSFTILYSFPQLITNSYVRKAVGLYIYPLLNQNWKIFAPEPPVASHKLKYRCYITQKGWSKWIDPGEKLLTKHYRYRFTYHRKEYGIYEYLFRQLEQLPENYYQNHKYVNAQRYIKEEARKVFQEKDLQLLQMELVYEYPPLNSIESFKFRIFKPFNLK